jgi:hypothetical protein
VVRHLTKSGTFFGLADFLTTFGIQYCVHCPYLWNANIPSYCIKMLTLVGFDVMCNKLEWMKIHGSNGSGLPLVQRYTKKMNNVFGLPKPLCPKWA